MRIETNADQMIIRETPAILWFIGLFFAAIGGIFVYGSLGGFSNSHQMPHWQLSLALIVGSTGVGVGIWAIIKAPVLKMTIDRADKTVVIERCGLTGRTVTQYSFDDIQHFFLLRDIDSDGDTTWAFALRKANGYVEQITARELQCEEFERKFVFAANEFMYKQIPAAQMVIEGERDFGAGVS